MKADLHCHSYFSDGTHSTDFLIQRAIVNGVSQLAITDHDLVTQPEIPTGTELPLSLVTGVEISCQWSEQEIHMVGLAFDPDNQPLHEALLEQRKKRLTRAYAMAEKLGGNEGDQLSSYLGGLPCQAYTRTHIANYLVAYGVCKNHGQAFKKFLSRRGKIYEPIQWMPLQTAIELITNAGGVTVIAHPSRYGFTRTKLSRLLNDFKTMGGTGLEAAYANLDPSARKQLIELSQKFGLSISSGSDFHSDQHHWTDIGKFQAIPADTKNAIWNHPRWHLSSS